MVTWNTVKELRGGYTYSPPTKRKIPFWDLKAVSGREDTKSVPAKDPREFKLVAAATYNALPGHPVDFPASLVLCVVSHKEPVFHLVRSIVCRQNKLFLELGKRERCEDCSGMSFHRGPCLEANVLEVLLHCLLFSGLIFEIYSNGYLCAKVMTVCNHNSDSNLFIMHRLLCLQHQIFKFSPM